MFGAVSGSLGCMGAMEAIKIISGLGTPLYNKMMIYDLRDMSFLKMDVTRRTDCPICSHL